MWISLARYRFLALVLMIIFLTVPVGAQTSNAQAKADAQTSTTVSAEMVKGKLNPATSKPGDTVALRLKDDVRSNGNVVMKKGETITGVVKSVKRADSKNSPANKSATGAKGQAAAQSMMEIEWLAPAGSAAAASQLNFALQAVAYTNPLFAHQQQQEDAPADAGLIPPRTAQPSSSSSSTSRQGGGLLGGVAGGATSTVNSATSAGGAIGGGVGAAGGAATGIGTGVTGAVSSGTRSTANVTGQAGAGLLASTPLSVDAGTASALQSNFGVSGDSLFNVGHGQVVSAGGTRNDVDLFSHMSNDTVITSPSKDFEVSSGAQMQFLVGAKRH